MNKERDFEKGIRGTGKIVSDTTEEIVVVMGENGRIKSRLLPSVFHLLPRDETREDFIIKHAEDANIDIVEIMSTPAPIEAQAIK